MALLDFFSKPVRPSDDDVEFLDWYSNVARKSNLNPDPDDPRHYYDYRAAHKAGVKLDDSNHLPSRYKHDLHPNRFIVRKDLEIWDSKHDKKASIEDLVMQSFQRKEYEGDLWQQNVKK